LKRKGKEKERTQGKRQFICPPTLSKPALALDTVILDEVRQFGGLMDHNLLLKRKACADMQQRP